MLYTDGVRFEGWRLRFTWASLLELQRRWGDDFESRVGRAFATRHLEDLAAIVAAVDISERRPDIGDVIAANPPVLPLIEALQVAWHWAYMGYLSAKEYEAAMQKEAAAAGDEKKPLRRFFSGLRRRLRMQSQAASTN